MTENNRKPEQQQNAPSQKAPGQQNQQGQPKGDQPGWNPGGQADQGDPAHRADRAGQVDSDNVQRGER